MWSPAGLALTGIHVLVMSGCWLFACLASCSMPVFNVLRILMHWVRACFRPDVAGPSLLSCFCGDPVRGTLSFNVVRRVAKQRARPCRTLRGGRPGPKSGGSGNRGPYILIFGVLFCRLQPVFTATTEVRVVGDATVPTEVLPCGTKLSRYGMNQPLDTALWSLDFSFAQDTRSITGLLPSGGPRQLIRNAAPLPSTLWCAGLPALRLSPECICTCRVSALDGSVHLMTSFSVACLRHAIFWTPVLGRLYYLPSIVTCFGNGLAPCSSHTLALPP